ncbi:unnamed protein product [Closterium sp. Yama58-4]|nr:unnamed protein product [Closterium sp. Yama58-4]
MPEPSQALTVIRVSNTEIKFLTPSNTYLAKAQGVFGYLRTTRNSSNPRAVFTIKYIPGTVYVAFRSSDGYFVTQDGKNSPQFKWKRAGEWERYDVREVMEVPAIRGANLGSWLMTEPWMNRDVFKFAAYGDGTRFTLRSVQMRDNDLLTKHTQLHLTTIPWCFILALSPVARPLAPNRYLLKQMRCNDSLTKETYLHLTTMRCNESLTTKDSYLHLTTVQNASPNTRRIAVQWLQYWAVRSNSKHVWVQSEKREGASSNFELFIYGTPLNASTEQSSSSVRVVLRAPNGLFLQARTDGSLTADLQQSLDNNAIWTSAAAFDLTVRCCVRPHCGDFFFLPLLLLPPFLPLPFLQADPNNSPPHFPLSSPPAPSCGGWRGIFKQPTQPVQPHPQSTRTFAETSSRKPTGRKCKSSESTQSASPCRPHPLAVRIPLPSASPCRPHPLAVRIPLPYWISLDASPEFPFVPGAAAYLDWAFEMGRKYGVRIWFSVHVAPGSQAGRGNARDGLVRWRGENVNRTLDFVTWLADRYGTNPMWLGMGLLNEPVVPGANGYAGVDLEDMRGYYSAGFNAIRARCLCCFVAMEGRVGSNFGDVMWHMRHNNVILEQHIYEVFGNFFSSKGVEWEIEYAHTTRKDNIIAFQQKVGRQLLVGEFCNAMGNPATPEQQANFSLGQMKAFSYAKAGWFFWSWKLNNTGTHHWQFVNSYDRGWLPKKPDGNWY